LNKITVFADRRHPQRQAIDECPAGAVFVIDSRKDARAASAGGILVSRLMKRGAAGVVTDGGFRDSHDIAKLDMPAFHHRPSAPTNLTLHQALEFNVPIGCGDAPVWPGDVIVGDHDGVVVIPKKLAVETAQKAQKRKDDEDGKRKQLEAGTLSLDMYKMREPLAKAGLVYLDHSDDG